MASSEPTTPSAPLPIHPSSENWTTSRNRPRKTNRRPPMSLEMKLESTIRQLELINFNLRDLLRTLATQRTDPRFSKYWAQFKKFAYQEILEEVEEQSGIGSVDWEHIIEKGGRRRVEHDLRKELLALSRDHQCMGF